MLKKILFRFFAFCLLLILIGVALQYFGSKKLQSFLKTEAQKQNFNFESLSTDFLSGDMILKDVSFEKDSLHITADYFKVKGVSYYEYFINKTINIDEIHLENSSITGDLVRKTEEKITKDSLETGRKKNKIPKIKIEKLAIKNTNVNVIYKDTFGLKSKKIDLILEEVQVDSLFKSLNHFHFKKVNGNITDFYAQVSQIQALKFKQLALEKTSLFIDSLFLIPLKSKRNFIYKIPKRKELLTLSVSKISIPKFNLETEKKTLFEAPKVKITSADFNIYADRVVFPNPKKKKYLYSNAIRKLPFDLKLDTVFIGDSKIQYEELSKKRGKPGMIFFDNIDAKMTNLTNIKVDDKFPLTKIHIASKFMNTSNLNIDWNYNIGDLDDTFSIKGSLLNVPSKSINSFLTPALNVKVTSGKIKQLYFNFKGNDYVSNGDFAIDFHNVKFRILKKGRVRKFQSFLANVLIKKSSRNKLRTARITNVKRDQTRSFWSFLWKNIKTGLMKTMR